MDEIPPLVRHDVDPDRDQPDVRITPLVPLFWWILAALIAEGAFTEGWVWGLRNACAASTLVLGVTWALANSSTRRLEDWRKRSLDHRDERRAALDHRVDRLLLRAMRLSGAAVPAGIGVGLVGVGAWTFARRAGLVILELGGAMFLAGFVLSLLLYLVIILWALEKGDRRTGPVEFIGVAECLVYLRRNDAAKRAVLALAVLTVVLSAIPR